MARVLLTGFCAVPGPRREGVQLRHVIRALMQHHSVDLLVVRDGDQSYVERQGNVRILRVPVAEGPPGEPSDITSQIQSFQRALKRQLEGADYDVVHCCDSWTGFVALEARQRLGYAMIYDLTRTPAGEGAFDLDLDARYARYEQACLRGADIVLAPTPVAVQALADRAGGRVVLSPPGVDVDRFDWEDPPTTGAPRILYAGSIDASRGVRILIRAMATIARERNAQLLLAGPVVSPPFARTLEEQIRELGLTDRVDITGPVDHEQIPAILATATICVVPAASDLASNPTAVYPSKLLEYLACRRAVVAPRRNTVALVVTGGHEALMFHPGDPVDLARAVICLLDDPALRDRIANAGYDRVRREFTASAARRAIRTAYATLGERVERIEPEASEPQKAELIGDDDFEATVIEQAAEVAAGDTGLHSMTDLEALDDVLDHLDGSQPALAARPAPTRLETVRWPARASTATPEESGVTNVATAAWPRNATDDDGTPADGVMASRMSARDNAFVAGEIDLPPHSRVGRAAHPGEAGVLDVPTSLPRESPDSDTGITPARGRNS